jgi:hypothetical protein
VSKSPSFVYERPAASITKTVEALALTAAARKRPCSGKQTKCRFFGGSHGSVYTSRVPPFVSR